MSDIRDLVNANARGGCRVFPLTRERERELFARWRDHGDVGARNHIVESNIGLVRSIVFRRLHRVPMLLEDAYQEGMIALLRATETFDLEYGVRFSTYAVHWINAYVSRLAMTNAGPVRIGTTAPQRKVLAGLPRAEMDAAARGDVINDADLAAAIGVKERDLMAGRVRAVLIDKMDIADEDDRFAECECQMDVERVRAMVATLPKKQRRVLERRYLQGDGMTLEEIGQQDGLSREAIRQTEAKGIAALRRRL